MDDQLVKPVESSEGEGVEQSTPFSLSKILDENCAEYMAMGMTYQEYWDGDVEMAKYFRQKYEKEKDEMSFQCWLMGQYVYQAVLCASPALKPFVKEPTPIPYMDEPMPITKQAQIRSEKDAERKRMEQTKTAIMNMVNNANKKFAERKNDGR